MFNKTLLTSVRQKKNGEDETGGQVDKWTSGQVEWKKNFQYLYIFERILLIHKKYNPPVCLSAKSVLTNNFIVHSGYLGFKASLSPSPI